MLILGFMVNNKKDIEEKNSIRVPIAIKLLLDQYIEILQKIYGNHLRSVVEHEAVTNP